MKRNGYSDETIEMCLRKGVFPYEYISSDSRLMESELPTKNHFYSNLRGEDISDDDYNFALKLFKSAKCNTIKDYMELYLLVDVLLLSEVFEKFRDTIFETYKLDPSWFMTTPSLAMSAALLKCKKKIDLLTDIDVITEIESSIRGGLTTVVQGKVTFNNKSLSDYDPTKPITSGLFGDINSLYPTIMVAKLPVGEFYELSSEEVDNFDPENTSTDGDYCYMVRIDYYIPDDVKRATDDLPMSIKQEIITNEKISPFSNKLMSDINYKLGKQKSLIASHNSQENYLISLQLLKVFIGLGLKVTKIHRIFRWKQKQFSKILSNKILNYVKIAPLNLKNNFLN